MDFRLLHVWTREVISTALPRPIRPKHSAYLPTGLRDDALAHEEVTITAQAVVLREIIAS